MRHQKETSLKKVVPQNTWKQYARVTLLQGFTVLGGLFLCALLVSGGIFIYETKKASFSYNASVESVETPLVSGTFPIGVDPKRKEIVENPILGTYLDAHQVVQSVHTHGNISTLRKVIGKLALMPWYQNMASVSSRTLVILAGERKEEVAENFAQILNWTQIEKQEFIDLVQGVEPDMADGKYFPGVYVVSKGATPTDVASLVTERFTTEVLERYDESIDVVVPIEDALIIASLLEREAYDFTDMREISGVIWNRLFVDMRLQLDATLQYAKGSDPAQPWWPKVRPDDKYLASAYNTYKNTGLPPAPIANPSLDSIVAALNPKKTDCMYYFHDKKAGFHCTKTYEEHKALIKEYYGKGK